MLIPRTLTVAAVAAIVLTACRERSAARPDADSAGMAGMRGMSNDTAQVLTLTQAQVQHGGVTWAPAVTGALGASVVLPAQVVPNGDQTARLSALGGGRVVDVKVQPGVRVTVGQPLVTLQSPAAGMAQSEIAKAQAEVTSREAQAAFAHAARERAERLLALKAIPRQDFDRTVADDQAAQSMLEQAHAELERARTTARQLGADAASGEIVIRSPLSGVVLTRTAVPGTVVEAGAPLIEVTNSSTLWLAIDAPENLSGAFRLGARLRFVVPAFPSDTFAARVEGIAAGLDSATRTLAIRGLIDNLAGRLRPAMLATVMTSASEMTASILLPEDAVQAIAGQPSVFVVMPMGATTMFTRRAVRTGARSGGRIVVLEGLRPGELVVTHGAFAIKSQLLKGAMPAMEM